MMEEFGRATVWICTNFSCGHIALFKPEHDLAPLRQCPFCGFDMHKKPDLALIAVTTP
jgi:hypothetical protein